MRTVSLMMTLAVCAAPLTAQANTDSTPPAQQTGYGAWFGSIPDMSGSDAGVLLRGTTPESPAAKAGLESGDLIVAMADKPVADLRGMVEVLRAHAPGDTISVVFWRDADAREHTVKVILGTRPAR